MCWYKTSMNRMLRFKGIIIFQCLFVGYFVWATYYFIEKSTHEFDETSCTGYGLLAIIFALIQIGIFLYIISPYMVLFVNKYLHCEFKKRYSAIICYVVIAVACLGFLIYDTSDDRTRLIPLGGLSAFVLIAFLLSKNKRKIPFRTVFWGLALQFLFGLLTIRWSTGRNIIQCLGDKVQIFLDYALNGAAFVYGDKLVFGEGSAFAFSALSTIYFLSLCVNILYYYNIMQSFVIFVGKFFRLIMGTTICESVVNVTNMFLGMSESPLLIKPYLSEMTESEIHSIMTAGFATIAGSTMAAYISFGANAADLITATVMSCPAALCIAHFLLPETEEVKVTSKRIKNIKMEFDSVLAAASSGAQEATKLVFGIIAGLIATLAFVYFINGLLSWMGELVGFIDPSEQWTIEMISGKIFIPMSYIMGVPWDECENVGKLIGIKIMVNEFVAFKEMGTMKDLSRRSKIIATYSICGFANPGSVAIMISALSTMAPDRKEAVTRVAFSAFLGGCLACFMTACVAGMLIPADDLTFL